MAANPHLSSFHVEGFRAIRRLWLAELGRVNLFVGKNNAGKTSLLEALRLYLHRNARSLPAVLFDIVREHSEYRPPVLRRIDNDTADLQATIDAVEGLFYGSFEEGSIQPIHLAPEQMPSQGLRIRLPWASEVPLPWESGIPGDLFGPASSQRPVLIDPEAAVLEMESENTTFTLPLEWFVRRFPSTRIGARTAGLLIPAGGMEPYRLRQMWDEIAVSGHEGLVGEALRIVVPNLDRILLVGESPRRTVMFKLHGITRPIPIQAMGDGVNRIIAISVALVAARGGVLLIDEIENGLHYSIQDQVWQAIFSLSLQFDVQIFATSHSWDSLVGFQYAANLSEEEGLLYRLEKQPDDTVEAIRFTEEEVEIAAEQRIEIR